MWADRLVKICGVQTPEHAQTAAAAGADCIGIIFAPGRRYVKPTIARTIADVVHQHAGVRCVGVFVDADACTINQVAETADLDLVQLSGNESVELASQLAYPLLKAIRMQPDAREQAWYEYAQRTPDKLRLLIDAHVPGSFGGAGVVADWHEAAGLAQHYPLILAGGLTPELVSTAIHTVRPWGVDVSSGVETNAVKDHEKIAAFIRNARQTWALL